MWGLIVIGVTGITGFFYGKQIKETIVSKYYKIKKYFNSSKLHDTHWQRFKQLGDFYFALSQQHKVYYDAFVGNKEAVSKYLQLNAASINAATTTATDTKVASEKNLVRLDQILGIAIYTNRDESLSCLLPYTKNLTQGQLACCLYLACELERNNQLGFLLHQLDQNIVTSNKAAANSAPNNAPHKEPDNPASHFKTALVRNLIIIASLYGYNAMLGNLFTYAKNAGINTDGSYTPIDETQKFIDDNSTALHMAAQYDQVDTLKLLVANNHNVNAKNNKGYTPLIMAVLANSINAVNYLLDLSAVEKNAHDNTYKTAFMHACLLGSDSMVDSLSRKGVSYSVVLGGTEHPLVCALDGGHIALFLRLLPNAPLNMILDTLIYATYKNNSEWVEYCLETLEEINKTKGFSDNEQEQIKFTLRFSLSVAIIQASPILVQHFIALNINIEAHFLGRTALQTAMLSKNIGIIDILLKSNARVDCVAIEAEPLNGQVYLNDQPPIPGTTILMEACETGDEEFIKAFFRVLRDNDIDLSELNANAKRSDGKTALMLAAIHGVNVGVLMSELPLDVTLACRDNKNAFYYAREKNHHNSMLAILFATFIYCFRNKNEVINYLMDLIKALVSSNSFYGINFRRHILDEVQIDINIFDNETITFPHAGNNLSYVSIKGRVFLAILDLFLEKLSTQEIQSNEVLLTQMKKSFWHASKEGRSLSYQAIERQTLNLPNKFYTALNPFFIQSLSKMIKETEEEITKDLARLGQTNNKLVFKDSNQDRRKKTKQGELEALGKEQKSMQFLDLQCFKSLRQKFDAFYNVNHTLVLENYLDGDLKNTETILNNFESFFVDCRTFKQRYLNDLKQLLTFRIKILDNIVRTYPANEKNRDTVLEQEKARISAVQQQLILEEGDFDKNDKIEKEDYEQNQRLALERAVAKENWMEQRKKLVVAQKALKAEKTKKRLANNTRIILERKKLEKEELEKEGVEKDRLEKENPKYEKVELVSWNGSQAKVSVLSAYKLETQSKAGNKLTKVYQIAVSPRHANTIAIRRNE